MATGIAMVRTDPRVDPDRLALWFFSGGGLLLADWLRDPPDRLRCVAATYPLLAPLPGIAATVEAFLAAAKEVGARLEVVDVPHGQHGFDALT